MSKPKALSNDLLDREQKVVADIIAGFRDIVLDGADRVDSTASTGQAACNSMSIGIRINGLIKSTEDLLSLTRKLRELWLVGPLKKPGEGDREAAQDVGRDAATVYEVLAGVRDERRREMTADGTVQYILGPVEGPPPRPTAAQGVVAPGTQQHHQPPPQLQGQVPAGKAPGQIQG